MRAGNVGNFVPADEPGRRAFGSFREKTVDVLDVLGEQMYPPTVRRRQPFDLFDDATLSTMPTI